MLNHLILLFIMIKMWMHADYNSNERIAKVNIVAWTHRKQYGQGSPTLVILHTPRCTFWLSFFFRLLFGYPCKRHCVRSQVSGDVLLKFARTTLGWTCDCKEYFSRYKVFTLVMLGKLQTTTELLRTLWAKLKPWQQASSSNWSNQHSQKWQNC